MNVTRQENGDLAITVPHSLGFSMIWDSFKCELKAARLYSPGSPIRRNRTHNARCAARLMISLSGKEHALPVLRSIARHVAIEVRR